MVHHRLTAYNRTIPPFIAKLRATKTTNPVASPVPTDSPIVADDVPLALDNECESSGSDGMADESSSDGEPHSGDQFYSDISHGDIMDDIEKSDNGSAQIYVGYRESTQISGGRYWQ